MASERPSYRFIAYIDESGDPGLRRIKPIDANGSSEWFVVSAVVVSAEREEEIPEWISELRAALNSRQMRDIHFNKLSPARKLLACEHVASRPVRCFVVVSNKRNMRQWENPFAAKIRSDNWFYCWMTRLLLERVTHWVAHKSTRQYGAKERVKLVYSERGGLSYSQLSAYYYWLSMKGDNQFLPLGNLDYETISLNLIEVHNHTALDGLKLADIVASAFFKAVDLHDTGAADASFAKVLGPRMANVDRLVAGYGVKLLPRYKTVLKQVQPEQAEIFRYFGYPRQWWAMGGP